MRALLLARRPRAWHTQEIWAVRYGSTSISAVASTPHWLVSPQTVSGACGALAFGPLQHQQGSRPAVRLAGLTGKSARTFRLRLFQTRSLLRVEAGDDHTPSAPPDEPPAPLGRFPREQWPWHRSRDTPSTFHWPPLPSCEPCCLQACGGRSMLQPAFAALDGRPPVVMQEGPCLSGGRAPGTIKPHTLRRTRKGPRAVITLSTTWAVLGASDPAGHHPGGSDC